MDFLQRAQQTAAKLNANKEEGTTPIKNGIPKPPFGKPGMKMPKPPIGKPPVKNNEEKEANKNSIPKMPKPNKIKEEVTKVEEFTEKETVVEVEELKGPLAKNNPFILNNTKNTTETESVDKVEETKETEEVEEKTIDNNIEEKSNEQEQESKEVVKEEPKEEKKTKRTRRSKKTEKAESTESSTEVNIESISIPKTEIDFESAVAAIKSDFVDEKWEEFKKDINDRYNDIVISNDMTSKQIKQTVAELTELRDDIRQVHNDNKNLYEQLVFKDSKEPEGFIERIKRLAAKGNNAEDRKMNAVLAVMNYKDPNGNTINLYEMLDEVRMRYNFTKDIMDSITYKSNVLITMLGTLKLEK